MKKNNQPTSGSKNKGIKLGDYTRGMIISAHLFGPEVVEKTSMQQRTISRQPGMKLSACIETMITTAHLYGL